MIRNTAAALFGLALGLSLAWPVHADEAPLGDHAARTVVVLVFDGLAPKLLAGAELPTFDRLRREGSHTNRMLPVFPSLSLVNGFTLSTGCLPEHHGIVSNLFDDPKKGFYDHSFDADWTTGCEGMHQAAERQGVRTAALGWYGAYSEAKGPQASIVSPGRVFAEFPTDAERAREVANLLQLPPERRPRLILAYFKGPDAAVHREGVDSEAARKAVRAADAAVATVLQAIEGMTDRDRVTLFVTSDHGMLPVATLVNVEKILANHAIPARARSTGTTSLLYFNDPSQVERAEKLLSGYAEFEVFRPSAAPKWAKLGAGPRTGDLLLSARPPYFMEESAHLPAWARMVLRYGPEFVWGWPLLAASHGYPPETPGMEGVLFARGSGIAKGREVPSIPAIDLHPTVMRLLLLEPGQPVDGIVANALLEPNRP